MRVRERDGDRDGEWRKWDLECDGKKKGKKKKEINDREIDKLIDW